MKRMILAIMAAGLLTVSVGTSTTEAARYGWRGYGRPYYRGAYRYNYRPWRGYYAYPRYRSYYSYGSPYGYGYGYSYPRYYGYPGYYSSGFGVSPYGVYFRF